MRQTRLASDVSGVYRCMYPCMSVYVPVLIFGFYRKNPYIRGIYENVRIMSAKLIGFTAFALLSGGGIVLFMRR